MEKFSLVRYVATLLIIAFFIFISLTVVFYIDIKNIYNDFMFSRQTIDLSVSLLQKKKYINAYNKSRITRNELEKLSKRIEKYKNCRYLHSDVFFAQVENFANLIEVAEILNDSVFNIATAQINIDNVFESKNPIDYQKKDISYLNYNFNDFSFGVFALFEIEFLRMQEQAKYLLNISQKLLPEAKLFTKLFGFDQKENFLVVFQDDQNIKATGGQIEAYGMLEVYMGKIVKFDTYDISGLDNLVSVSMTEVPPAPLIEHQNKSVWLPGDANWYPDWAETAKRFKWFFENSSTTNKKYADNLSGVIALNMSVFESLLKETGELVVYGEKIDHLNFRNILRERNKKYISALLVEIFKEISLDSDISLKNIFYDQLALKNVLLYFFDVLPAQISHFLNYDGVIRETDKDYLMIVDSSFSEGVVRPEEEIFYRVTEEEDGVFVDLDINYANVSSDNYDSYLRIYVPLNSVLSSCNVEDDVLVYQEFNKTVFALPLFLEAESMKNLHCKYFLADTVKDSTKKGEYFLYVQKQPGKNIENFTVDLSFINSIELYQPSDFFLDHDSGHIKWQKAIKTDLEFLINF